MKLNIKKSVSALCALALMTACTGDFDEMNQNPNAITAPNPSYMMPYIQEYGAHIASWEFQVGPNLHCNLYAQYFANSATYFNSDSYTYNSAWVTDGYWNSYYVKVLTQAKSAKTVADADPTYSNIFQCIRIFTARCTAQTTDLFGDIPYSEAGIGNADAKYDSQESIYNDVFKELTEAVELLNAKKDDITQVPFLTNQDLIFNGDLSKWMKFANSLRLRYAMRLAYKDAAKAKQEAEAALKAPGGLMTSNDDNAGVLISGKGANGWPLFQISGWGEFCMSKTMENILKNTSTVLDPRTSLWFGHTDTSTAASPLYAGVPNGLSADGLSAYPDRSYTWGYQNCPAWNLADTKPSNYLIGKRQKVMEYSEVCFLKAEAALRGWAGAGDAKSNYLAGIKASFDHERDGLDASYYPTADDDTYITTGKAAWEAETTEEGHMKQIITQKWIALYPDGEEAWTEFRRTGYPDLMPVAQSLEPTLPQGTFIKKLRYTDDELRENTNATDGSLNQGKGDGMNVRVWWDTARYN